MLWRLFDLHSSHDRATAQLLHACFAVIAFGQLCVASTYQRYFATCIRCCQLCVRAPAMMHMLCCRYPVAIQEEGLDQVSLASL